jgi:hypothetical protein
MSDVSRGLYLRDLMNATIALACASGMLPIAVDMIPDEEH